MPDGPLDAALDELYGADPSEFVTTRKQLSATLRGDGEKVAATELQAARRPSTAMWALNQLARQEPDLIEHLLDAGNALYAAQTRGSNRPDVLRDAIRSHREALEATIDAALTILGERANDGFRGEIVSTLRAVSTDDDIARQLRAGRLVRDAAAAGFPDMTGLTLVPALPDPKPSAKPKPAKRVAKTPEVSRARDDATKAARDQKARAEKERAAQERARLELKERAREAAEAANAEAERAQARVDELQHELEAARREMTKARARSRAAKSKLRDLR